LLNAEGKREQRHKIRKRAKHLYVEMAQRGGMEGGKRNSNHRKNVDKCVRAQEGGSGHDRRTFAEKAGGMRGREGGGKGRQAWDVEEETGMEDGRNEIKMRVKKPTRSSKVKKKRDGMIWRGKKYRHAKNFTGGPTNFQLGCHENTEFKKKSVKGVWETRYSRIHGRGA